MKERHLKFRLAQLKVLADASYCPRGQVAAMLIDPERNTVLADGYNGPPRGLTPSVAALYARGMLGV